LYWRYFQRTHEITGLDGSDIPTLGITEELYF